MLIFSFTFCDVFICLINKAFKYCSLILYNLSFHKFNALIIFILSWFLNKFINNLIAWYLSLSFNSNKWIDFNHLLKALDFGLKSLFFIILFNFVFILLSLSGSIFKAFFHKFKNASCKLLLLNFCKIFTKLFSLFFLSKSFVFLLKISCISGFNFFLNIFVNWFIPFTKLIFNSFFAHFALHLVKYFDNNFFFCVSFI